MGHKSRGSNKEQVNRLAEMLGLPPSLAQIVAEGMQREREHKESVGFEQVTDALNQLLGKLGFGDTQATLKLGSTAMILGNWLLKPYAKRGMKLGQAVTEAFIEVMRSKNGAEDVTTEIKLTPEGVVVQRYGKKLVCLTGDELPEDVMRLHQEIQEITARVGEMAKVANGKMEEIEKLRAGLEVKRLQLRAMAAPYFDELPEENVSLHNDGVAYRFVIDTDFPTSHNPRASFEIYADQLEQAKELYTGIDDLETQISDLEEELSSSYDEAKSWMKLAGELNSRATQLVKYDLEDEGVEVLTSVSIPTSDCRLVLFFVQKIDQTSEPVPAEQFPLDFVRTLDPSYTPPAKPSDNPDEPDYVAPPAQSSREAGDDPDEVTDENAGEGEDDIQLPRFDSAFGSESEASQPPVSGNGHEAHEPQTVQVPQAGEEALVDGGGTTTPD